MKLHCRALLYDYIIDENIRFILDEDHGKIFTIFDGEIVDTLEQYEIKNLKGRLAHPMRLLLCFPTCPSQ